MKEKIEQPESTPNTTIEREQKRLETIERIRADYGILFISALPKGYAEKLGTEDDETWFRDALGLPAGSKNLKTVRAAMEALPDTIEEGAILIGGSPHSVYEQGQPWIERLEDFVRIVHARKKPILGVCFGHQLVAKAFGGMVEKNPKGREFGTVVIDLDSAGVRDSIFEGMPKKFPASASHRDIVTKPPSIEKTAILARNDMDAHQALAIGDTTRSVQFHPEIKPAVMEKIARFREPILREEGFLKSGAPLDEFIRTLKDTPEARQVLHNFVRNFVVAYRPKQAHS